MSRNFASTFIRRSLVTSQPCVPVRCLVQNSSDSNCTRSAPAPSQYEDILKHQNDLFSSFKAKIMSARVPRIEKIEVQYTGRNISDDAMMLMNKMLSTPYQCAMHISQNLAKDSVLAFVKKSNNHEQEEGTIIEVKNEGELMEGKESPSTEIIALADNPESDWIPWDMHRPLEYDCELKLLNFDMRFSSVKEIQAVNRAYWKSCALILGAVAPEAFEENLHVKLAYLPDIPEECGAFCYDIELSDSLLNPDGSSKWKPDASALVGLTKTMRHVISQHLNFERLEIHKDEAIEIFQHNKHQLRRIEESFFSSVGRSHVPVYKFGKYIDICDGPLMPSTSTMYHFVVTAIHQLQRQGIPSCLWRLQGLSLPKKLQVHHAIWAMLEHRARKLVKKDLPFTIKNSSSHDFEVSLHKYRSIENETKRYNIATGQWLQDEWKSSDEKVNVSTT